MFSRRESFAEYIRFYPVATVLLAINIGIQILTWIPGIGPFIFFQGMGINGAIASGEWWRFFTPMFLHDGIGHLLFNMFALFIFAPELEKLIGKMRFLTLYLLSGLFANIATFFIYDYGFSHVGASGAIFGIFGAYGALIYYTKNALPELRQTILPIIIIGVIMTFVQSNINIAAHIFGLIVGFLIGLSYFNPKRITSWRTSKK